MPPLLSPTPGSDCHAVLFDVLKLPQILQALQNVIISPALFSEFIQKLRSRDGPLLPSAITAGYGPCESSEEQYRGSVRGLVLAYTATEEGSQQHEIVS